VPIGKENKVELLSFYFFLHSVLYGFNPLREMIRTNISQPINRFKSYFNVKHFIFFYQKNELKIGTKIN